MNQPSLMRNLICSLTIIVSFNAHAYPGESIVLDPSTGDYIITYWDEEEPAGLEQATFVPGTKINPSVQSAFRMDEHGNVSYRYKVYSNNLSRQIIGTVRLEFTQNILGSQDWPTTNRSMITEAQLAAVHDANSTALTTPHSWSGGIYSKNGYRISWNPSHNPETGIRPGSSQDGFGFASQALPSVGVAQLVGEHPPRGWSGEGPSDNSAIRADLEKLQDNDFVSRNAAIPTIAVPTPFDAAALLDRIHTQVDTWPSKQLLDPALAARIDSSMVAAANAYRLNNFKAGKENIESVRKLLAHEHNYLDHDDEDNDDTSEHKAATRLTIDRLAARVLDFDLRYVLSRSEHEHDHDHDHDRGDKR